MSNKEINIKSLTSCRLWETEKSIKTGNIPVPTEMLNVDPEKYKYTLGIFAFTKEFFKITSYFLNDPNIMKVTIIFKKIDNDLIKKLSTIIRNVNNQIIHVSGFCNRNNKYFYEFYINTRLKNEVEKILDLMKKQDIDFEVNIENIEIDNDTVISSL
ncbi:MAG: hypothetical protein ACTSRA_08615 [Promethearchaeota archaeon]